MKVQNAVEVTLAVRLYSPLDCVTDEDCELAVAILIHDIDNMRPNDFVVLTVQEVKT